MADRTFTSSDVLRIFEFHLDEREQETVRMFFEEPSEINLAILTRLLNLLLSFVSIFTSSTVGLVVSLLSQNAQDVYLETVDVIFMTNRAISREIGRIDA